MAIDFLNTPDRLLVGDKLAAPITVRIKEYDEDKKMNVNVKGLGLQVIAGEQYIGKELTALEIVNIQKQYRKYLEGVNLNNKIYEKEV